MTKYIFVCGGVMSGIGKGVSTASIARILASRGFRVTAGKIDPYLNVDAGTMNPVEHGECFVTEDGMECDQDIGNYERFLGADIPRENYMTSGSVYLSVIQRERNLGYDGKCVEIVPHIPLEVIARLDRAAKRARADFMIVEVGGTVGEYQNILFLEAARMMRLARPKEVMFVLVSYLPIPEKIGEMKTKPTQHAVRAMNAAGIQPDFIIARSRVPMDAPRKDKLALLCNLREPDIISAPDVDSIYEIPVNFEDENLSTKILKKFGVRPRRRDMRPWRTLVQRIRAARRPVRIGIVGKYFGSGNFTLTDSYISVLEALKHGAWFHNRRPELVWLDAEAYEKNPARLKELSSFDGIVVPGGFGSRGVEGIIKAIEYARRRKIPYFGLCYGLQLAAVEFARHACGLKGAHTLEIDPHAKHPIIATMQDQIVNIRERKLGGTMRLGAYACRLAPGTIARKAYGETNITERHRHRYEISNEYVPALERRGLVASGVNPERNLVEIMELKGHPFFLGTQFHPELKSRPLRPHPLFRAFIAAALKQQRRAR
ncbi:CTP synthase [Candidatus Parcubacteria bacterium]|nr:MAG: CTP synthase [Candidatus Parcubacteria bacterium]